MVYRTLIVFLFLCMVAPQALADAMPCPSRKFTPVSSPERFVYRNAYGQTIRLAGIGLSDSKIGDRFAGLANTADARMQRFMNDGPWTLAYITGKPNRLGECLAYAKTASGVWIQKNMLEAGMAYVITTPSDQYTAVLLRQESAARERLAGLWRAKEVIVRDARTVREPRHVNSYQIVEGRIHYTRDEGRYKYACLSNDPWQSVCFLVLNTAYAALKKQGIDLLKLAEHQAVQVRGQLMFREGLKIYVRNPVDVQLVSAY